MSSIENFTSVEAVHISADKNMRYRRRMEDAHFAVDKFCDMETCGFFGVFDGHVSAAASTYCKNNFPQHLEAYLKGDYASILQCTDENDPQIKEMWTKLYAEMDKAIFDSGIPFAGCTAVTALIWKNDNGRFFSVANVGDSQCVLFKEGESKVITGIHNTSNPEEVKLIESKRGFIKDNRVNGMIEVTRSLGDNNMKLFLSNEPAVITIKIENETAAIIACDGVFDVLTLDNFNYIIHKSLNHQESQESEEKPDKSENSSEKGGSLQALSEAQNNDQETQHEIIPKIFPNIAKSIIGYALKKGTTDNVTCMVIKF